MEQERECLPVNPSIQKKCFPMNGVSDWHGLVLLIDKVYQNCVNDSRNNSSVACTNYAVEEDLLNRASLSKDLLDLSSIVFGFMLKTPSFRG